MYWRVEKVVQLTKSVAQMLLIKASMWYIFLLCISRLRIYTGISLAQYHVTPFSQNWASVIMNNPYSKSNLSNSSHDFAWWRHQMETFSALLVICAGNSPVPGEFTAQWPVTRSFDVFFDLRLNGRLSKQSRGGWFETPSCTLWRHCN